MTTNTIIWGLLALLLLYLLAMWVVYQIQEYFIFKPEKLPSSFQFKYSIPFTELFFNMEDGAVINGLLFPVQDSRGLVVYLHGNSRSIKGWSKYAKDFMQHGFDVVMVDYRGFGKSIGSRNERALKSDMQHVYQYLTQKYPESQIIIYGRSLGSGFAAKLASQNHPRMLILDAPYYSLSKVAERFLPFLPIPWILKYNIRTNAVIKYVRCPIRIIHGTRDKLIPIRASQDLAEIMPMQTRLYTIEEGGHNNLPSFPQYYEVLQAILEEAMQVPYERHLHRPELF